MGAQGETTNSIFVLPTASFFLVEGKGFEIQICSCWGEFTMFSSFLRTKLPVREAMGESDPGVDC